MMTTDDRPISIIATAENKSYNNMEQQNHSNSNQFNHTKDDNSTAIDKQTTPANSNHSSPTKSQNNDNSPTKGKSKKRNDTKRKNRKQQGSNPSNQSENKQPSPTKELKQSSPNKNSRPEFSSTEQERQLESSTKSNVQDNLQDQPPINSTGEIKGAIPQRPSQQLQPHNDPDSNTNFGNSRDKKANKQIDLEKYRDELKKHKDQLVKQRNHIQTLVDQAKQQKSKTNDLETALLSTTRTCNQLEKLLQQELSARTRLESENESLEQSVSKLKNQISIYEKNKFNSDEIIRVLNATLMERETELSILKLKLTRLQTNQSSISTLNKLTSNSISSMRQQQSVVDPRQAYTASGRSNSEFDQSSYVKPSMRVEQTSVRASTSQLKSTDEDALIWASVPQELTPSKRPLILEKSFQSIYGEPSASPYHNPYGNMHPLYLNQASTPLIRDRRYKTLPRSMKSPSQEFSDAKNIGQQHPSSRVDENEISLKPQEQELNCQITNLDDSNSTGKSICVDKTINTVQPVESSVNSDTKILEKDKQTSLLRNEFSSKLQEESLNSNNDKANNFDKSYMNESKLTGDRAQPEEPKTPSRRPSGLRKIFDKFKKSDSSASSSKSKTDLLTTPDATPEPSPFKRNAARSTMVGAPKDIRSQISPIHRQANNFQTDKPFAEWDTDMLVDWLTMIGLSMYSNQCRRWVKCGAHIMDATPAEVDKGLGITNHLHRKKLRLAISELNGDCDKITKAAAKLDYLWVARWLDDIGLPQYKEAFINARVDGRVLNYLTVEDLVSMGVKSILHHASIRCGIRVLRSINFNLQLLKRRATSDEVEKMSSMRQQMDQIAGNANTRQATTTSTDDENNVALWTCHRVMEWLRMIDFAEFAPNLRGSGVHGGLVVFEDGFNIDTMCTLLSIPASRTLLRRHLATFFKELIGDDQTLRKRQYQELPSQQQLNPLAEIKANKKSLWFPKLKSSKVAQDCAMDDYLCPMYPVEPQLYKNQDRRQDEAATVARARELTNIPESIDV